MLFVAEAKQTEQQKHKDKHAYPPLHSTYRQVSVKLCATPMYKNVPRVMVDVLVHFILKFTGCFACCSLQNDGSCYSFVIETEEVKTGCNFPSFSVECVIIFSFYCSFNSLPSQILRFVHDKNQSDTRAHSVAFGV